MSASTDDVPFEALTAKAIVAKLGGQFPIDEAVIEALPKDCKFDSIEHFGVSAWTITGRLDTVKTDGSTRSFFVKVAYGEHGRMILRGEWESSQDMYRALPIFIPEPIAFGQYKVQSPMCHFYIQQFVEMDVTSAPDPAEFTSKLADFHRNSVNPTGKFGYQVSTCDGRVKNEVAWTNTWPELYTQLIEGKFKLDIAANGPWPEYERAFKQIIDKVIPHLLVGLKSEGEPIKPCLIHGDLWDGNMGIRMDTGESITFDASSYYAHNEMEFGQWKLEIATHLRSDIYTRHYLQNYPAAEPVEEFDDRVRLYSLRGGINYSSGHPQSTLRISAYNDMLYLIEKYAPCEGVDAYDPAKDANITGATIENHAGMGWT